MDLSLKTLPPSSGRQKEIRRVNNFVSCKVLPADFAPPGSAHFQYLHSGQWCVSRAADTVCSRLSDHHQRDTTRFALQERF